MAISFECGCMLYCTYGAVVEFFNSPQLLIIHY